MSSNKKTTPLEQDLKKLSEFYKFKKYEDAENLAISITQQHPGNIFSWKILGEVFRLTKKLAKSLNIAQKVLEMNPQDPDSHSNKGRILMDLNNLQEAEASYKKAITLKVDSYDMYNNLGVVQQKLKKYEGAILAYHKAIELNPNSAESFNNLATIQQNLGNLKEAEINFQKFTILKPGYAPTYMKLGKVQQELGKIEKSEINYRKAINLKLNYKIAHYNLGTLFYESFKNKDAKEQFELANNTLDSENYLLRCLYLLNKKDDFNNQLDSMLNEGKVNAVIGSLISRSDIKYSTNKKNVFCKDPMKYILETDLNKQCDFNKIFIEAAQNILDDETISFRSQGLLNNGQQSAGNLFNLKSEAIKKIQETLQLEVERYRYHFKDSNEGLLINWPKNYNLYGWLIRMKSGGSLDSHMHDGGWLSGSVYINVPPKSKTDSGNLVLNIDYLKSHPNYEPPLSNKNLFSFLSNKNKIKEVTNQEKIIDVVTGSLCLFPSSLLHHTIPFESKEDRIVLAFDVRAK